MNDGRSRLGGSRADRPLQGFREEKKGKDVRGQFPFQFHARGEFEGVDSMRFNADCDICQLFASRHITQTIIETLGNAAS